MPDEGKVRVCLRDVRRKMIHDEVRVVFSNQRLRSYDRSVTVSFKGRSVRVAGIPVGPNGLYQVHITPAKYRYKSIFLNLWKETAELDEILFVDAEQVNATFPTFTRLGSNPKTKKLHRLLTGSGITAGKYSRLADLPKAGIFNLFSKMEKTRLSDRSTVSDHILKIQQPKPARFLARVTRELIDRVRQDRTGFHAVPGVLHEFPKGWKRLEEEGSFKTHDSAGNLQLTFAANARGDYLVDADIDDHQGVKHAFDVMKHKLTGKDTHPYNIHQILIFFQGVDPGYELS